jgi:fructokinase
MKCRVLAQPPTGLEMTQAKYRVVGLGELLWDLLPTGRKLGGAPANFAYITNLLGDEGIPASRVGTDDLGTEVIRHLNDRGLLTDFVQTDPAHPTSTVKVEIDRAGQPRFEIRESIAWDFLQWTSQWKQLAASVDAVCFGSLAQRSPESHATILNFVRATGPNAVRIFDVNLRQEFFTADVLAESMKLATIVKLNHEELPRIMRRFALDHHDEESSARRLIEAFSLKLVCITRGNSGGLLVTPDTANIHTGFPVKVADTIGAGDAFTAALVHQYLRNASLDSMNEMANRVGAWVASETGAMPAPKSGNLPQALAAIG